MISIKATDQLKGLKNFLACLHAMSLCLTAGVGCLRSAPLDHAVVVCNNYMAQVQRGEYEALAAYYDGTLLSEEAVRSDVATWVYATESFGKMTDYRILDARFQGNPGNEDYTDVVVLVRASYEKGYSMHLMAWRLHNVPTNDGKGMLRGQKLLSVTRL